MFCNFCGTENPANSNFCLQCGERISVSSAKSESAVQKYNVEIFRESQMFLLNPPINIAVDGVQNGSIANGETITLKLNSGEHNLIFSQSIRKKSIAVNLIKDIRIVVKWNRLTGGLEASILE